MMYPHRAYRFAFHSHTITVALVAILSLTAAGAAAAQCSQGALTVIVGNTIAPTYDPIPLELPTVRSPNVPTVRVEQTLPLQVMLCDSGRLIDITLGRLLVSASSSYGMLSVTRDPPSVTVLPRSEWKAGVGGQPINQSQLATLFMGYEVPSTNAKVVIVVPLKVLE